jgi:PII-like signaling protein
MLTLGKALKVTIYVTEGTMRHGHAGYAAILDFLFRENVAGASVFKGVAGFGAHHRLHASSIVEISAHLPLKIEFIESAEKVEALLPRLRELTADGVIEVQETTVMHARSSGTAN